MEASKRFYSNEDVKSICKTFDLDRGEVREMETYDNLPTLPGISSVNEYYEPFGEEVYRSVDINCTQGLDICSREQSECQIGDFYPLFQYDGCNKVASFDTNESSFTRDDFHCYYNNLQTFTKEITRILSGVDDVGAGVHVTAETKSVNTSSSDDEEDAIDGSKENNKRLLNISVDQILLMSGCFPCPILPTQSLLEPSHVWVHRTIMITPVTAKGTSDHMLSLPRFTLKTLATALQAEEIDYEFNPRSYIFKCIGYVNNLEVAFRIQVYKVNDDEAVAEMLRSFGDSISFQILVENIKRHFGSCTTVTIPTTTRDLNSELKVSYTSAAEESSATIIRLLSSKDNEVVAQGAQVLATITQDRDYPLMALLLHFNILALLCNLVVSSCDITTKRCALVSLYNLSQYAVARHLKVLIPPSNLIDIITNDQYDSLRGIEVKRSAALLLGEVMTHEERGDYRERLEAVVPGCQDVKLLQTLQQIMV